MGDAVRGELEMAAAIARAWWVFLATGIAWLILSLIVFRMDLSSVFAVGVLFGVIAISAGATELGAVAAVRGGWRWLHAVLGVVFVAIGIVCLAWPGKTFVTLASIIGWYFLFKGIFDVVAAFEHKRRELELWWLQLVAGGMEIGLAFWVAGDFEEKVILLLVWVGLTCMFKGVTDVVLAFRLRGALRESPRA